MSAVDAAAYVVHLTFAALWAGSVLFVTYAVLPLARAGDVRPEPLSAVAGRLAVVSRTSALFTLLSGGWLAGALFTTASLTGTGRGHLVLTMVALWLTLAALVEVGLARMRRGLDREKVRTPATDARPFMLAASLAAVLLLVVGALLAGGFAAL